MNSNTIQVTLIVKDDGSVVVQQFGKHAEEALDKTGKGAKGATDSLTALKSNWLAVTAATAAAGLAISKVMNYMDLAAKAAQAETSFRSLAAASGESADQIIANMKRASAQTIDDSQLMQKAAKAMLLEFSGEQITKMTEMARMGARTTGEDVGQVFDKIVDAISTNMPRALKQYGLVTQEQIAIVNQALAEGVTEVNLYSTAWSNFAVQQAKIGPLMDNTAEKIQRARAEVQQMREEAGGEFNIAMSKAAESTDTFGGKIAAAFLPMTAARIAISYIADASVRLTANIADLVGQTEKAKAIRDSLNGKTSGGPIGDIAAAETMRKAYDEQLKASLGAVARKKAELETMKALDKVYFKFQEDNIKYTSELMKAAGGDEYTITSNSLKKMEELNAEYYARTAREIELEAAARQKAELDKVSDLMFTAEKMKALDAESATRAAALAQQRTMLSIQTAKTDIDNLKSRLGDYQTYYDSLKAKMDKNIEDERKHLAELIALRQQRADIEKTTADLIAKITGADASLTAKQRYESGRSTLNQQYYSAMNLGGQDQIAALEAYKQAVAAFQAQFATGIPGVRDIFGKTDDILSAKSIAADAISDIERAAQNQKSALASLAEEKQKQVETDQLWGSVLQEEAAKSKAGIDEIKTTIQSLSDQILNMQKEIEIRGIDAATPVIEGIAARLEALHRLAAQPLNIGGGGSSSGSSGLEFTLGSGEEMAVEGAYASGTPYVPRTGNYRLHQSETVLDPVAAEEYRSGKAGVTIGDVHIHIPANAAPQRPEDWSAIVRNQIVPELKRIEFLKR